MHLKMSSGKCPPSCLSVLKLTRGCWFPPTKTVVRKMCYELFVYFSCIHVMCSISDFQLFCYRYEMILFVLNQIHKQKLKMISWWQGIYSLLNCIISFWKVMASHWKKNNKLENFLQFFPEFPFRSYFFTSSLRNWWQMQIYFIYVLWIAQQRLELLWLLQCQGLGLCHDTIQGYPAKRALPAMLTHGG